MESLAARPESDLRLRAGLSNVVITLISARSPEKLTSTLAELGPNASGHPSKSPTVLRSTSSSPMLRRWTACLLPRPPMGPAPFGMETRRPAKALFHARFWGQYWAVHTALPHLAADASVVLMSGAASARPLGAPAYAACNAALEGLARGLALNLRLSGSIACHPARQTVSFGGIVQRTCATRSMSNGEAFALYSAGNGRGTGAGCPLPAR